MSKTSDLLVRGGATFFFTGYFPVAPATFASFVTLLLWWRLPLLPLPAFIALLVALAVVGTALAGKAEAFFGHDGKPIVIDEVLGALLTVGFLGHSLYLAVAGFLLFRVLDVVKPPPAYQLQSLRGGYGIMADDVTAGIYGNLILRVAGHFWPLLIK
jgi:phosphatidylglycerophosphatase A